MQVQAVQEFCQRQSFTAVEVSCAKHLTRKLSVDSENLSWLRGTRLQYNIDQHCD